MILVTAICYSTKMEEYGIAQLGTSDIIPY